MADEAETEDDKKKKRRERLERRKAARAAAASTNAASKDEKKKARLERREKRKAAKVPVATDTPNAEGKKKTRRKKKKAAEPTDALSAEEKKKARQERRERQRTAKAAAAGAPDADEKKKARLERREKRKAAKAATDAPDAEEKKKARQERREKRKAKAGEAESPAAPKKKKKKRHKKDAADGVAAAKEKKAAARQRKKEQKAEKASEPKKAPPVFALQPTEEELVASFAALDALVLSGQPKRRFVVDVNGVAFHAHFERSEYSRLFVMLGGEAPKDGKSRAHFERRAWGEMLPGSVLWISDPTLNLSEEISLGWYVGTREKNYTAEMARLVDRVATDLGLARSDIVFYAGSGGGFAAMMCARFLPGANCIVINPQIDLSKHHRAHRKRLAQVFSGATDFSRVAAEHPERVSILAAYPEAKNLPPTVYVQNRQDKEHFDAHFALFCDTYSAPKEGGVSENGRVLTLLFEHGAGHVHEPRPIVRPLLAQALAFFDQVRQAKK